MSGVGAIKEAVKLRLLRKKDKKDVLYSPYANTSGLNYTSDRNYANAAGAPKIAFDGNRQGTVKFSFQVWDKKWISILLGAVEGIGATPISITKVYEVGSSNTIELSAEPMTGSMSIFTLENDNVTYKKEQAVGEPASAEDTYSISGKTVTFNATTCPVGTKVMVNMLKEVADKKSYTIKADKFPDNYEIYGYTKMRYEDGTEDYMHLHIGNVKPKSNFDLTLSSSDIAEVTAEFDILNDENNEMGKLTPIDATEME